MINRQVNPIRDMVIENPTIPSRTLARMIYALNPQGFDSVESVRSKIRYYRGKHGETDRKKLLQTYGKSF